MDMNRLIDALRQRPDAHKMGMIASHLGIVRRTSLGGETVSGIEVRFDRKEISRIIEEIKGLPGVLEVLVETCEGVLNVGDDIMAVVVGGDTRENVFPALVEAVHRIKTRGSAKKEFHLP